MIFCLHSQGYLDKVLVKDSASICVWGLCEGNAQDGVFFSNGWGYRTWNLIPSPSRANTTTISPSRTAPQ